MRFAQQLAKFASNDGPNMPSRLVRYYAPISERRENLEPSETAAINKGEHQWLPQLIQPESTPIPNMMASPSRQGLLGGLLGAAGGAGLGYAAGPALGAGRGPAAVVGGLAGGLLGGVFRGVGQHHRNEHLKETMRRLPPEATKRDLDAEQMLENTFDSRFGKAGAAMPAAKHKRSVQVRPHVRKPPNRTKRAMTDAEIAAESCPHCSARQERGDDGYCNRCRKPWPREKVSMLKLSEARICDKCHAKMMGCFCPSCRVFKTKTASSNPFLKSALPGAGFFGKAMQWGGEALGMAKAEGPTLAHALAPETNAAVHAIPSEANAAMHAAPAAFRGATGAVAAGGRAATAGRGMASAWTPDMEAALNEATNFGRSTSRVAPAAAGAAPAAAAGAAPAVAAATGATQAAAGAAPAAAPAARGVGTLVRHGMMGAGAGYFDPSVQPQAAPGETPMGVAGRYLMPTPEKLMSSAGAGIGAAALGHASPDALNRTAAGYGTGFGADMLANVFTDKDLHLRHVGAGIGAAAPALGKALPTAKPFVDGVAADVKPRGFGFIGSNPELSAGGRLTQQLNVIPHNILNAGKWGAGGYLGYRAADALASNGVGGTIDKAKAWAVDKGADMLRPQIEAKVNETISSFLGPDVANNVSQLGNIEKALDSGRMGPQGQATLQKFFTEKGIDAAAYTTNGQIDPAKAKAAIGQLKGQGVVDGLFASPMGQQALTRIRTEAGQAASQQTVAALDAQCKAAGLGDLQSALGKMGQAEKMMGAGGKAMEGLSGIFSTLDGFANSMFKAIGIDGTKMSSIQKILTFLGGAGVLGGLISGNGIMSLISGLAIVGGMFGPQIGAKLRGFIPGAGQQQQPARPASPYSNGFNLNATGNDAGSWSSPDYGAAGFNLGAPRQ